MQNFSQLDLPKPLSNALEQMGFKTPTPIQAQTLEVALGGQDVLGTAQTGTGKTGAFAIPLAAKLISNPEESVLVLTPTRELATQVMTVFRKLITFKTALLIGGEPIGRQYKQLKARPRLIVGTPGRINDHLRQGTLKLGQTRSLVLDETDLMLDMGFDIQIATIINKLPQDRQTLMFSATLPPKIEGLAAKYLKDPVRVSVGQQSEPGKNIDQEVLMTPEQDKYGELLSQLEKREGSIIVFVKTKRGADRLSVKLNAEEHRSGSIHGDLRQSKRERVLKSFRNKKCRILVATDVAARGIDVPHIRHVINYDLPQCPEDYIHRIGRTARAGEKGAALSFITNADRAKWRAIERLLDPNAKQEPAPHTKRRNKGQGHRKGNGGGRPSFSSSPKRKPRFGSGGSGGKFSGKPSGRFKGESKRRPRPAAA